MRSEVAPPGSVCICSIGFPSFAGGNEEFDVDHVGE